MDNASLNGPKNVGKYYDVYGNDSDSEGVVPGNRKKKKDPYSVENMSWSSDEDDFAQTEGRQTMRQSQRYGEPKTPTNPQYASEEKRNEIYFLGASKPIPETTFDKPNSELVRRSVALVKSKQQSRRSLLI